MIQANELRIGNKVKCSISNDAGNYTVLGVPAWGYDGCGDGKEPLVLIDRCPRQLVPESKLKPIRLTPELLEKNCGIISKNGEYSINGIGFYFSLRNGLMLSALKDNEAHKGCFFLHELQNIIRELTSKELTINL